MLVPRRVLGGKEGLCEVCEGVRSSRDPGHGPHAVAVTLPHHGTVETVEGAEGDRDEGPGLAPTRDMMVTRAR